VIDDYNRLLDKKNEWVDYANHLKRRIEMFEARDRSLIAIHHVEYIMRQLAERGYANTPEYARLVESQSSAIREFKQSDTIDTDDHVNPAKAIIDQLESKQEH
jgi:hypothetical protein